MEKKQTWNKSLFDHEEYKYVGHDGAGQVILNSSYEKMITIEQFKKYVLKIEETELEYTSAIEEDCNYLIDLFKELNIK